jgi:hypothetical protein
MFRTFAGIAMASWIKIMAIIEHCRIGTREAVCLALFAFSPVADSALAQSTPTLGYAAASNADPKRLGAFKKGLTDLGYVEGKSIRIEYREGVLDTDYHRVMAEFVDRKVKIILAANAPAAIAAAAVISIENIFTDYIIRGQTAASDTQNMAAASEQEAHQPAPRKKRQAEHEEATKKRLADEKQARD